MSKQLYLRLNKRRLHQNLMALTKLNFKNGSMTYITVNNKSTLIKKPVKATRLFTLT